MNDKQSNLSMGARAHALKCPQICDEGESAQSKSRQNSPLDMAELVLTAIFFIGTRQLNECLRAGLTSSRASSFSLLCLGHGDTRQRESETRTIHTQNTAERLGERGGGG